MRCRAGIVVALMLFVSGMADSENHALKFEKQIGAGWQTDKSGWMSFVAFSPDGTMVASDGSSRMLKNRFQNFLGR
jgi:glucose/arabinose dehydrogenase